MDDVARGTSLKGWNVVGDANWEVVDQAVQATKGTGYLVTPIPYGDFLLTAEFWVSDDANSGIFIRCQDPKNITASCACGRAEPHNNLHSPDTR